MIPRLARDIRNELPEQKGFSERNIKLMLQFYRTYPALFVDVADFVRPAVARTDPVARRTEIVQPLVARLPWAHNVLIASYAMTRALPDALQSALPSIESIEAELSATLPGSDPTKDT